MISGKIVKLNMRGIDRNRKGTNHASSRQYPVDHSWWIGHRNRMGIGGTDSVHLHHRHPVRHSSVQDGGTHLDAVWQNRAIRRRSRLCLGQHPVGGAGRRSAIWVQACSTASPSSAFRSASSRSKWPSSRSGRSAHRSTVCNNCFCSRSGAAHYHRALHRTFLYTTGISHTVI